MMRQIRKAISVAALCAASMTMAAGAWAAEEWPFTSGDYWEVTGIDIKDGGGYKYAKWLATEWRENLEFAKSKGWIKDYMILSNQYPRSGEPSIYLIRIMEDVPTGAEGEKRAEEYMAWRKKSIEQMQGESGNRAEYREVMSTSLLQELNFRN